MPTASDVDLDLEPVVAVSRPPRLRLAFGRILWRVTLATLILFELILLTRINRKRIPRLMRLGLFLIYSPRLAFYAFLIGAVVAVLADLLLRLVIGPAIRAWYHPRVDGSAGIFHLAAGESALDSAPARRRRGLGWEVGSLVLTDRTVWFFPRAWDAEPWSLPLARLEAVSSIPAPRMIWGFLSGVPDQVRIESGPEAVQAFVVADPAAVLAWFDPPALPDPA